MTFKFSLRAHNPLESRRIERIDISFEQDLVNISEAKSGLSSPDGAESAFGNDPEENFGKLFLA
jgi:hypothetical protein